MVMNSSNDRQSETSRPLTRTQALSLAVVFVLLMASLAILYLVGINRDEHQPRGDRFKVTVESPSVAYRIFLPNPIESNGIPWYLLKSLHVTRGNPVYSIINTTKGPMLSVEGDGNVTIEGYLPPRGREYYAVSPQNVSGGLRRLGDIPYLVFLDASREEGTIRFTLEAVRWEPGSGDFSTEIITQIGSLRFGWLEIFGWTGYITP